MLARLKSIHSDAAFIDEVRRTYPGFACFANERCGTWYVRGHNTRTSYFKSTDGHAGHWQFSSTRLNLFVAELAAAAGGAVIVDSTRRGKPFPDALTKTVPAWCAMINHIVLGEPLDATPFPRWLPASEVGAIRALLPTWVAALPPGITAAIRAALDGGRLSAPLRAHWACNAISEGAPCSLDAWEACVLPVLGEARGGLEEEEEAKEVPLLCVSASRLVAEGGDVASAHAGWAYVQGAGDDAETWSCGLTPALFWRHADALLACGSDAEACACIADLLRRDEKGQDDGARDGGQAVGEAAFPDCYARLAISCEDVTCPEEEESGAGTYHRGRKAVAPLLCLHVPGASITEVFPGTRILASTAAAAGVWVSFPGPPPASCPEALPGRRLPECDVVLLSPSSASSDALGVEWSGAAAEAGGSVASATRLAVPVDKAALRHADRGRVWQDSIFPAVQRAVRRWQQKAGLPVSTAECGGDSGGGGGGSYLLVAAESPVLAPHATIVAALAMLMSGGLRRCSRSGAAPDPSQAAAASGEEEGSDEPTLSSAMPVHAADYAGPGGSHPRLLPSSSLDSPPQTAPVAAIGPPMLLTKADIRSSVALAQAALRVPAVPREIMQQLNTWLLSPARWPAGSAPGALAPAL